MKAEGAEEMVMEKIMVFFRRVVGPDQGRYHTREKGDGKFTKKIDALFRRKKFSEQKRHLAYPCGAMKSNEILVPCQEQRPATSLS